MDCSPPGSSVHGILQARILERVAISFPSVYQFSLVAQSCLTLHNPMDCSTPGFPAHHQLPEPTQTHVHHISDAIHNLIPPPAFNLSHYQDLSSESVLCIRWPKYWSFRFSISPSNEYSGLISFRMNLFDLLAVLGTLKSLLRHHSLKATILQHSVQFSCSVMSNSLWTHVPQHTRPLCPSPTPGIYSNSCPSSQWCHPTISSSVVPFPFCLQSFLASGSFQMSQFFTSGGQILEFQLHHQSF